jgi:hypothetical protein
MKVWVGAGWPAVNLWWIFGPFPKIGFHCYQEDWEPRWYSGNVDITSWILRLSESSGSILVDVKTVQMLFNVVWSFLLTVWMTVMRLCAELITSHINLKPIRNSGKFLREGNIHTTDSCASPFFFCYQESWAFWISFIKFWVVFPIVLNFFNRFNFKLETSRLSSDFCFDFRSNSATLFRASCFNTTVQKLKKKQIGKHLDWISRYELIEN